MSILARLFPQWALRREEARARLHVIQRAYQAGASDRTSGWRKAAQQSANQRARRDLATTRAQARELYWLNPWARGAINSIVANLVGCGIRPQSRVVMPRLLEPNESFNDRVDAAWESWARSEDFYAKQRLIEREKLVAGEVLIRFAMARDGREIPLTLEPIKSERLALDNSFSRRPPNTVHGVEFGADGLPSAYWIYPEPPSDQALAQATPERVPAEQILHIRDVMEPGQIRGLTRFMTCAGTFESLAQYLDFVLTKERVATAFALMINRVKPLTFPTPASGKTTDDEGNVIDHLEGGMILHGDIGEDIKGVSSSIQPESVDKLSKVLLRQGGRGMDIAYETLSRDLSQVTYLSARQGENQDRRHWKPDQDALIQQFCVPVRREFIRLGAAVGKWRIPSGQLERYSACDWIPDGWDWIDPGKDIAGDIEAIKAGLMSPQEACAKRGKDWFQVLTDLETFKAEASVKKLALTTFPDLVAKAEAAAKPQPEPQEPASPETPEDTNEENENQSEAA